MKSQILKMFLAMIPNGVEMHPHQIEDMIIEIAPDIEERRYTKSELKAAKKKFSEMFSKDIESPRLPRKRKN